MIGGLKNEKSKWLWNYQKIIRKQAEAIRIYDLCELQTKSYGLFRHQAGSPCVSSRLE